LFAIRTFQPLIHEKPPADFIRIDWDLEPEKVANGRLRFGVRWQAKRDTAFEAVTSFELEIESNLLSVRIE
jgi:hypothetical protein